MKITKYLSLELYSIVKLQTQKYFFLTRSHCDYKMVIYHMFSFCLFSLFSCFDDKDVGCISEIKVGVCNLCVLVQEYNYL